MVCHKDVITMPSYVAHHSQAPTGSGERSNLARALTLVAMSLGYGVVQLDVTIVNTALHSIGSALGGGVAELLWVVNAYKRRTSRTRHYPGLSSGR
jgi:DHA2 family methylenomycin A resistance protein-like MFS transporter